MTETLIEYLNGATDGASYRTMGGKLGMIHTTLRKQLLGDDTPASTVVGLCRAYGLPLAPAFVAAGFITEEEARTFSGPLTLATVPEIEIAKEMLRRVAAGKATSISTEPLPSEIIDEVLAEKSSTHPLEANDDEYDPEHGVTFDHVLGSGRTREEIAAERAAKSVHRD